MPHLVCLLHYCDHVNTAALGNATAILLPPQKFLGMDIGQQFRILQQLQNATSFGEYMHAERVKLEQQERACATDTCRRSEMRELRRGSSERITNLREFRGRPRQRRSACKASKTSNGEPPSLDSQIREEIEPEKLGGNKNADNPSTGDRANVPLTKNKKQKKIIEKLQHQIRGKTRNLTRDSALPRTWRRFLSLPAPSFLVGVSPRNGGGRMEEGGGGRAVDRSPWKMGRPFATYII